MRTVEDTAATVATSVAIHPVWLTFSEPSLEETFRKRFIKNRITADLQWSCTASFLAVFYLLKLGSELIDFPPLVLLAVALNIASVFVPCAVVSTSGRESYALWRTTIVATVRFGKALAQLAVWWHAFPGPFHKASSVDLAWPLVMPFTFHMQVSDSLLLNGFSALVSCWMFASPSGWCNTIATAGDPNNQLAVFSRVTSKLGQLQTATTNLPLEFRFDGLQACRALTIYWSGVISLLIPSCLFYVLEYYSRKSFISSLSEKTCGETAEVVSQLAARGVLGLSFLLWQMVAYGTVCGWGSTF